MFYCIAYFIKPYQMQYICKLDFGKVLWNRLYIKQKRIHILWKREIKEYRECILYIHIYAWSNKVKVNLNWKIDMSYYYFHTPSFSPCLYTDNAHSFTFTGVRYLLKIKLHCDFITKIFLVYARLCFRKLLVKFIL